MLPVLLLIGTGKRRRFWIPLPVLVLWPFWLLAWPVWLALWIFRASWERPLRTGLMLGAHLSGLRVDVNSADGERVHVRMI